MVSSRLEPIKPTTPVIRQVDWAEGRDYCGLLQAVIITLHVVKVMQERCSQRRQSIVDGLPNQVCIDAKIEMDQFVAHSGDLLPWDIRILSAHIIGYLFDRLADDFQFSDDCALRFVIVAESRKIHFSDKSIDAAYGDNDVSDIERRIPHR